MRLLDGALIRLKAVCYDCRKRHEIVAAPATWLDRMSEWEVKHRGHRIEFRSPGRSLTAALADRLVYPLLDRFGVTPWWMQFAENVDIKLAYATHADFTITLASLGSSATFVAGRESTAVSNTTNLYLDYLIGGKVTTGTTPTTGKSIRIYGYGSWDDTPTYPDVLDGTDSAETITSTEILNQLPILAVLATNGTSDRVYYMSAKALSLAFGGVLPKNFGLYVAHDTAVALNATGTNHDLSYTGVYATG